jgi:hypothetical protein
MILLRAGEAVRFALATAVLPCDLWQGPAKIP